MAVEGHHGDVSDPGTSARDASQRAGDIRVMTLNLWGRRGAWLERWSVLIDGLRDLQPDLVAFVEAIKTEEYDQVVDLLGPGFHVAHQAACAEHRAPTLDIAACTLAFDEPIEGVWASDHFGVVADLAVPSGTSARRDLGHSKAVPVRVSAPAHRTVRTRALLGEALRLPFGGGPVVLRTTR
jgi:hypothetical protein